LGGRLGGFLPEPEEKPVGSSLNFFIKILIKTTKSLKLGKNRNKNEII
jgi:hypothetical protein